MWCFSEDHQMNEQKTGGPAFPVDQSGLMHGMTLRDYFAAKALPICYQNYMHDYFHEDNSDHDIRDSSKRGEFMREEKNAIADLAYEMADAMLRARNES
jgi:hypothetical protein